MRRPRSVRDADVAGKHVLVRADLNVPLEDGRVADDTRIRASLPTLELLLERDAATVAVCSHLGRPKGEDPAFSMAPVAERLRELLPDERVEVLENTRFDPGETKNDPESARRLAEGRDLFVNDAFGSSHRAHASTVGVASLLPAYAGLLLEQELEMLGRLLGEVERPFVLVAGGAKVEDKLGVLVNLGGRADTVLVGGKMAEELREENPLPYDAQLPVDVVAAAAFEPDAETRIVPYDDVPDGWLGLDIGPETRERFGAEIRVGEDPVLERADGGLRVAAVRGGHRGGRESSRRDERLLGRRRRRLRARRPGARPCGQRVMGLDGRRCRARAARGEGASGSGRYSERVALRAAEARTPSTCRARKSRIIATWRTRSSTSNVPCPVSNTYTSCGCSRAASLSTYRIAWPYGQRLSLRPMTKNTGARTSSVKLSGLRSSISSGSSFGSFPPRSARS